LPCQGKGTTFESIITDKKRKLNSKAYFLKGACGKVKGRIHPSPEGMMYSTP